MGKTPTFTIPPAPAKKTGAYLLPVPGSAKAIVQDQGQDYQGTPGSSVVAIGDATINYVGPASGFGQMVIYTLTSGHAKGTRIYVGHAQPVANLQQGDTVNQGDAVATLVSPSLGDASKYSGWVEVGIADPNADQPMYRGQGHAAATPAGAEFKKLLGAALTPAETAQATTAQGTATAQTEAASSAYNNAAAAKAGALAAAKATGHESDPWVVVQKDKKGNVTGLGETIGMAPPKNVLTYGDQPLTKNELSSVWNARYADIFQAFTGRVARPADIVPVIQNGISTYGLQAQLAALPGFTSSPIFRKYAPSFQAAAKPILGGNAPTSVVSKAIAEGWDQTAFEQALRQTPAYLKGPEFQTNVAQNETVYKTIYGAPDPAASQSIRETAAAGWSTDQFAAYLRNQPQYKTSLEYQSHAVNFLDAMGLLIGARPTLTPGAPAVTGGAAVPDMTVVPGKPQQLTSPLPFTPKLAGAKGLA